MYFPFVHRFEVSLFIDFTPRLLNRTLHFTHMPFRRRAQAQLVHSGRQCERILRPHHAAFCAVSPDVHYTWPCLLGFLLSPPFPISVIWSWNSFSQHSKFILDILLYTSASEEVALHRFNRKIKCGDFVLSFSNSLVVCDVDKVRPGWLFFFSDFCFISLFASFFKLLLGHWTTITDSFASCYLNKS